MDGLARVWAMDDGCVSRVFDAARQVRTCPSAGPGMALAVYAREYGASRRVAVSEVRNGVGVLRVRGVLMEKVPWWFDVFGIEGTAYRDIAAAARGFERDSGVSRVELEVDSPGGEAGVGLERVVRALGKIRAAGKRVDARIGNAGLSAAYWIASQAKTVTAADLSLVGSIGVYAVIEDSSAAYEDAGIKVHLIRSGPLKGTGVDGVAIAAEELAPLQDIVDRIADRFVEDVARGRGVSASTVKGWASGRAWLGMRARGLGLVDGVLNAGTEPRGPRSPAVPGGLRSQESGGSQAVALDNEAAGKWIEAIERRLSGSLKGYTPAERELARLRAQAATSTLDDISQGLGREVEAGRRKAGVDFLSVSRARAKARRVRIDVAMAEVARERPELFEMCMLFGDGAGVDFPAEARALAKDRGVGVGEAMKALMEEQPGRHELWLAKMQPGRERWRQCKN